MSSPDGACARLFGAAPAASRRLHGGDLSEVLRLDMPDGRRMVAKRGARVAAEARMLRALAAAGAPVPAVLGEAGGWLFLQWLEETPPGPDGWRAAGQALAALHRQRGERYGWAEGYGFGPVPIDNRPATGWPAFWAERRLVPLLDALPAALARRAETLAADLPARLPAAPPPALLHGDLWRGNLLFSGPRAFLIDPACYHGDPEVDLAMLALFGAVPEAFGRGYGPPAPGAAARRPIYQLWPAMVHVALFGAGYHALVARLLDAAGV